MSTEQQAHDDLPPPPMPMSVANAGRRRLGKVGIGAAGVLLTLESRVAMATNPQCVAPSAAALSHGGNSNYVEDGRCGGLPPEKWANLSKRWPCSADIKFGALFRCSDPKYANVKLIDILRGYDQRGTNYRKYVGRAFATTYFNILAGSVTVLDERKLFKMWNDLQTRQVYSPMPKVYWSASQVRGYLETTYLA